MRTDLEKTLRDSKAKSQHCWCLNEGWIRHLDLLMSVFGDTVQAGYILCLKEVWFWPPLLFLPISLNFHILLWGFKIWRGFWNFEMFCFCSCSKCFPVLIMLWITLFSYTKKAPSRSTNTHLHSVKREKQLPPSKCTSHFSHLILLQGSGLPFDPVLLTLYWSAVDLTSLIYQCWQTRSLTNKVLIRVFQTQQQYFKHPSSCCSDDDPARTHLIFL